MAETRVQTSWGFVTGGLKMSERPHPVSVRFARKEGKFPDSL